MNTPLKRVAILRRVYKTDDDYVHRLIFGIGQIRNCAISDKKKRLSFDKILADVIQNLTEMKIAIDKCGHIISDYKTKIQNKEDAIFSGSQITVTNPIDDELNLLFKDVFIRGMMVTRDLNRLALFLGYNIEFLFSDDDKKFEKGAEKFSLERNDKRFVNLVNFVKNHKSAWYGAFREMRKNIEHMGWSLDEIDYLLDSHMNVTPVFPKVEGMEIEQINKLVWENIVVLCEEICVFLLSLDLEPDMIIVRIPEEERAKHNKTRYMVSHKDFPGVTLNCS